MPAASHVLLESHAAPNALLAHSAAHTGPSPRSMHVAFATQSVGALQGSPTATGPATTQAIVVPVSSGGGHHAPSAQPEPSGVHTGGTSSTPTSTTRLPCPIST